MLAAAFLAIAAASERHDLPPEGQIPLTRNEIATLFAHLITQSPAGTRRRLRWSTWRRRHQYRAQLDHENDRHRRPARRSLTGVQTKATFRLSGDAGLTAAAITRRLAIHPTRAFEAGDPVSSRSPSTHDCSLWLLSSSAEVQDGTELAEHLHRLLATLEPLTPLLWELVHEGYEANWYCWIASHTTEHAAELDRTTLRRLLALPGDLWLDVCGDGKDDE